MCNINIIAGKTQHPRLATALNVTSWFSHRENDDAEGALFVGENELGPCYTVMKSLDKLDYTECTGGESLIATHQRYATSGKGSRNTHPFEGKHLILMHNGIFSGLGNNKDSDTKMYFQLLEKCYEQQGHSVVEAIKLANATVNGSYSILLYEKSTHKTFYYKNGSTSMYYLRDKGILVMSTKDSNVKVAAKILGLKGITRSVNDNVIIEITKEGKLKERGSFQNARATIIEIQPKYTSYADWQDAEYLERGKERIELLMEYEKEREEERKKEQEEREE